MSKMDRADDVVVVLPAISVASAAVAARFVMPRAMKLVQSFGSTNAAYSAAPVVTFASSKGNLADTLDLPNAAGAGETAEADHREEENNAFAEGTELTATVGTPSAGDTANVTLVLRPL